MVISKVTITFKSSDKNKADIMRKLSEYYTWRATNELKPGHDELYNIKNRELSYLWAMRDKAFAIYKKSDNDYQMLYLEHENSRSDACFLIMEGYEQYLEFIGLEDFIITSAREHTTHNEEEGWAMREVLLEVSEILGDNHAK